MKTKKIILSLIILSIIIISVFIYVNNNSNNNMPQKYYDEKNSNLENKISVRIESEKVQEHLIQRNIGNYNFDREYSINVMKPVSNVLTRGDQEKIFSHEEYMAYYTCKGEECATANIRVYPSEMEAQDYLNERTEGWVVEMKKRGTLNVYEFSGDTTKKYIWKKGSMIITIEAGDLHQFNIDIDGREGVENLYNAYFEKYS